MFLCSIVTFPLGRFFQVSLPIFCFLLLLWLYLIDWKNCVLHRLPVKKFFLLFFACIGLQLVLSEWFALSLRTMSPNFYRGYLLPFIGMECIRNERDLRRLVWACAGTALYEGLDGIWQFVTGYDLIQHTAILRGRLTGSLGTYRVGNYMGMLCLPALGIWFLWQTERIIWKFLLTLLCLSPAFFLWIGAQARIGYLALVGGLYIVCCFVLFRKAGWKVFLLPVAAVVLLLFFGPERVSFERILADGRIPIWTTAWKTFLASPFLGWGGGTFAPAYLDQGLIIQEGQMQHPHNIYLQLLVDGGIVGFLGVACFLAVMTLWPFRRIRQAVRLEQQSGKSVYWRLTALFWAGWLGFLIVGFAGHDFYRTWWVSTGFTMLGIVLGACVNGAERDGTQQ